MSRGLQFLVSYTYSRTEEEVAFLNPQDGWDQLTRVVTAADTPHRMLISSTWNLPFFSGRGGVLEGALGGWQVNGIVTFQSGLPVATTAGAFLVAIQRSTTRRWGAGSTPARRP